MLNFRVCGPNLGRTIAKLAWDEVTDHVQNAARSFLKPRYFVLATMAVWEVRVAASVIAGVALYCFAKQKQSKIQTRPCIVYDTRGITFFMESETVVHRRMFRKESKKCLTAGEMIRKQRADELEELEFNTLKRFFS